MTIPDEMLSIAEDLLTIAAPRQVEKMRDALVAAYERGRAEGYDSGYGDGADFVYEHVVSS